MSALRRNTCAIESHNDKWSCWPCQALCNQAFCNWFQETFVKTWPVRSQREGRFWEAYFIRNSGDANLHTYQWSEFLPSHILRNIYPRTLSLSV